MPRLSCPLVGTTSYPHVRTRSWVRPCGPLDGAATLGLEGLLPGLVCGGTCVRRPSLVCLYPQTILGAPAPADIPCFTARRPTAPAGSGPRRRFLAAAPACGFWRLLLSVKELGPSLGYLKLSVASPWALDHSQGSLPNKDACSPVSLNDHCNEIKL